MIRIQIGSAERTIETVNPSWIAEQIQRRRLDGVPVCVRVTIDEPPVNMVLCTQGCPRSNARHREPNRAEQQVFDLWEQLGLNKVDFSPSDLELFLRRVGH